MKRARVLVSSLAFLSLSGAVSAQELGQSGDVSFGADRLMGFYLVGDAPGDFSTLGLGVAPVVTTRYAVPRLGIDFFVIDQLSIGGSIGFWNVDWDDRRGRDDSASGFLLYPRVGYAFPFSESFGIWPRGGLTFTSFNDNDEVGLSIEGMFWAAPTPHFAFTFGPVIDVGIAGDGDEETSFGLIAAGILGWI